MNSMFISSLCEHHVLMCSNQLHPNTAMNNAQCHAALLRKYYQQQLCKLYFVLHKRTLTISSHELLKEVFKILWSFQHVCKLMEMEVRHKNIFGISCHVDHLKGKRLKDRQFTTQSCLLETFI